MNKVIINQRAPERVDSWVIEELVKIAKDISIQSSMIGELLCYYTYRESVNILTTRYPNLKITGIIDYYIKFQDPVVLQIMIDTYYPGKVGILENDNSKVSKINNGLFLGNNEITSFDELVKFPISMIEENAFRESSIQHVDVTGITDINGLCFSNCHNLTSIGNLKDVEILGFGAFGGSENLVIEDLNCPNLIGMGSSRKNINSATNSVGTFVNTKLKNVSNLGKITTIPSGMASYDNNRACFSKCTELESVVLPETLIDILMFSFFNCTKLTQCNIPSSVRTIGLSAFKNCKITGDIDLSNITNIEASIFENNNVSNVNIQNATSVGNYAFKNCKNATFILPEKFTSIGTDAFKGTSLSGNICIEGSVGNNFADDTNIKYITAKINTGTFSNQFYTSNKTVTDLTITLENVKSRSNGWNTSANNQSLKHFYVNLIGSNASQLYEIGSNLFAAPNILYVKVTCDNNSMYVNGIVFNINNQNLKTFIIDTPNILNITSNSSYATLTNIKNKLPNMIIYVPDLLYDDWILNESWSQLSSIIKKISLAPIYNTGETDRPIEGGGTLN